MNRIRLSAALAACVLASSANASNLGYSTLGIDLTSTHYDHDVNLGLATIDGTAGIGLYGSYQFNDNFFISLAIQGEGASTANDEVEFTQAASALGGGFALPVGSQTDVVFRLAILSVSQELCYNYGYYSACGTSDDDGYSIGAGVRHMLLPNVEINAEFTKINLDQWDDDEVLTVGAALWVAQHHSFRLTLGDTDGAKTSALGYRYTF